MSELNSSYYQLKKIISKKYYYTRYFKLFHIKLFNFYYFINLLDNYHILILIIVEKLIDYPY